MSLRIGAATQDFFPKTAASPNQLSLTTIRQRLNLSQVRTTSHLATIKLTCHSQNQNHEWQESKVEGGVLEHKVPKSSTSIARILDSINACDFHVHFACAADDSLSPQDWIVDTGAHTHIVNDKKWFTKLQRAQLTIGTADQANRLSIEGAGDVGVTMLSENSMATDFTLSETLYAPNGSCNLLSLQMLATKAGLHGTWNKDKITFKAVDDELVGEAYLKDGIYQVQVSHETPPISPLGESKAIAAATVDFDDEVWKWHRKLGHLGWENIRKLLKQSTGINLTDKQIKAKVKAICPVCATTKALVKIPRDPARRRYNVVGALLITDTWGPYAIIGIEEVRYALFVTDDATRFTWVRFFSRKNEIPQTLTAIRKMIETTHDTVARRVRFDNEFYKKEIAYWAEQQGVTLEPSAAYAHHQVGTQERAHRTIREKAASMIQEQTLSGQITKIITERGTEMLRTTTMPEMLWPEAMRHAVWLKNRSPTKAHKFKMTPFEALEQIQPDFSRDKIWGSRAYVTVPPETRIGDPKLHTPRGWLGYFVGCESESIYRIWNPDKEKVMRISVARIDEDEGLDDEHEYPSRSERIPIKEVQADAETTNNEVESEKDTSSDSTEDDDADQSGNESESLIDPAEPQILRNSNSNDLENENSQSDGSEVVVSKHFQANVTTRKRKQSTNDSEGAESDDEPETEPRKGGKKPKGNVAGRVPDDSMCDHCMSERRTCDGQRPCSTCIKRHHECIEQTEATKNLIPTENRGLPSAHLKRALPSIPDPSREKEKIQRKKKDISDRYQYCRTKQIDCTGIGPCDRCQKDNIDCVPWQPKQFLGGVPAEEKCYGCFKRNNGCDGKNPCNQCQERNLVCVSQENHAKKKCNKCESNHTSCNRERPCNQCIKKKQPCGYYDNDNLVRRLYKTEEQGYEVLSEDDDECTHCRRFKRNCGGTEPCYRCVKHGEDNCTWIRKGGLTEYFRVGPYSLTNENEIFLDENKTLPVVNKGKKEKQPTQVSSSRFKKKTKNEHHSKINDTEQGYNSEMEEILDEDLNTQQKSAMYVASALLLKKGSQEPRTYGEAMKTTEAAEYHEATENEMQSLLTNHVFEVVDLPEGKHAVSTRWVYKKKTGPDGQILKYKARLTGRGFEQQEGLDFHQTYSGVVKPTSYRILFALMIILGWTSQQMDVKTAFLNAEIEEELYVRPPPPYQLPPGKVWRILRALYGFKQSARMWYGKLKAEFIKMGFRVSNYDECVFIHQKDKLIVAVHVDDIRLFSDSLTTIDTFKTLIRKIFTMTDEDEDSCYLGMHVEQGHNELRLHQSAYVQKILERFNLQDLPPVKTPCDTNKKLVKSTSAPDAKFQNEYLQMFGSLNYLPTITRPDLAYAVSMAGRYNSNPNQDHLDAITRIFAYLIATKNQGLCYTKLDPSLKAFVDSDYGGCSDTAKSTTGWVFTLAGGPISWSAKRQMTVSLSSTEAEYIAATEVAKEAVWIKNFINDLDVPRFNIQTVPVHVDNKSALKLAKNPEDHQRTKHIKIHYHYIRQCVEEGDVELHWIKGTDNPADAFTKALGRPAFEKVMEKLNVRTTKES